MSAAAKQGMRELLARLRRPLGERADIAGSVVAGYAQMAITALVNIILVPLYLNALGRTGFGLLMMLIGLNTYAVVAVLWLMGGLNRGLGVAFARAAQDEFVAAWAAAKWGALVGAGAITLVVASALWLAPQVLGADAQQVGDLQLAFALFFMQLAVGWLYSVDRIALNVSHHQTMATLLTVGQQLVLGPLVYLALVLQGGLSGVMAAFLASHLATLFASSLMRRRMLPGLAWRSPFDPMVRRELRAMLSRQGTAFQLFGVLMLSLQADILVVGLIGGPAIAAEYALVWKVAEIILQGLWRIPDAFQPKIIQLDTRGEAGALKHLMRRVDWLVVPLAAGAGLCYALLGHWVVVLWVGAQHAPAGTLLYALAGAAIFWLAVARLPIVAGLVTGRMSGLLKLMTVELVGKIALMAATIGAWGLLAPVVAINAVHALGVAYGYRHILGRLSSHSVPAAPQ